MTIERQSDPDLPLALMAALAEQDVGCCIAATAEGTILVAKIPAKEIAALHGTFPVAVRHELYAHCSAPVIRTLLVFYDDPVAPFALETFINVADPDQRADFARLAEQTSLSVRFYDERLTHRLEKRVTLRHPHQITAVLAQAEALRQRIPAGGYDFDRAKADVLESAPWPPASRQGDPNAPA